VFTNTQNPRLHVGKRSRLLLLTELERAAPAPASVARRASAADRPRPRLARKAPLRTIVPDRPTARDRFGDNCVGHELKHRAIQWMVDPIEDGGLGLDPATAAEMVGHDDGGYLIATVYTKLGQRRAIARTQRAMDAYQQRRDAADDEPPRLQVVRDAA
jgi:hypothetical protein